MSIVWLLWTNMWFVHLFSNRLHWLHLLCHSGNQRCSHICITHHRGWVYMHDGATSFLLCLRLHQCREGSELKKKNNIRWLEEVFWVFRCGGNSAGCIYRRFPANGRVLGSPQQHLPQILRVVAWLRLLRRRAVGQREEEMAGPRPIQSVRYEGPRLGKWIAAMQAEPTCTRFTLFIRATQNLVASRHLLM